MRPTYRTAYKLPLGSSVLHLGQPQPHPFNPLIPIELRRRRTVRTLKIKIPSKTLGRQRCEEGLNFVAKRLMYISSDIQLCITYEPTVGADKDSFKKQWRGIKGIVAGAGCVRKCVY